MTAPDGPHLAYPFRIGADGRTVRVLTLEEHVRDEIVQLILTNPGEHAFLPEFGGGARRLVFEGGGQETAAMAKSMLSQALTTYLGHRVTVEELDVESTEATITIDVRYRLAGSEESRRLRFERSGG